MKITFLTHVKKYSQGKTYEVDDTEAKKLVDNGYAIKVKKGK